MTLRLVTKDERTRSSEQIARDLNRQLPGIIPGVIIQTRASGGNQQQNRLFGGGDSRISLEIQGDDLQISQRVAQGAKAVMDRVPEDSQRARRPRRRPSGARHSGRSSEGGASRAVGHRRRQLDPHQRRRHAGGVLPRERQRVPDHRPAPRRGPRPRRRHQQHPAEHGAGPGHRSQEPDDRPQPVGTDRDPAQEPGAHHPRHGRAASRR